jgi:predicted protein tyrosine phosphatase
VEIRVAGYVAASLLLEREPRQWHALVMLDSGRRPTGFVEAHALSHLYLSFDDIEQPRDGKRPPSAALIERGLEFARGKDKLLVCCRAGRGRSVAMAYLIRCREVGVAEAVGLLDPTRHRPNRLVVSLGEGIMDGPSVLPAFDEWRVRHAGIRLSDYDDQMEQEFEALEAQGAVDRICEP